MRNGNQSGVAVTLMLLWKATKESLLYNQVHSIGQMGTDSMERSKGAESLGTYVTSDPQWTALKRQARSMQMQPLEACGMKEDSKKCFLPFFGSWDIQKGWQPSHLTVAMCSSQCDYVRTSTSAWRQKAEMKLGQQTSTSSGINIADLDLSRAHCRWG